LSTRAKNLYADPRFAYTEVEILRRLRLARYQKIQAARLRMTRGKQLQKMNRLMGDFYGLPTRILSNDQLSLEFLSEVGPRIVRLKLPGNDQNFLAETPDFKWVTPHGDYFLRGGHRLWRAPEIFSLTYMPDGSGVRIVELSDGVRLSRPAQLPGDLHKSIEIQLHADRPAVTLIHQLTNDSERSIECAPWAITQLVLGGIAIMPQPHDAAANDGLQPNRHLTLWPYARWNDARLHIQEDVVLIEGRSAQSVPALKIGALNRHGWIGYLIDGVLFRKSFEPASDQLYPDLGSNVEVYCNDRFLELETLGGLRTLQPGQTATHVETWELLTGLDVPATLDGAKSLLQDSRLSF
jgi:hypothetical protein